MLNIELWNEFLRNFMVAHIVFMLITSPIFSIILPLYILLFTNYWWLILLYGAWMLYDYETPVKGARLKSWFRGLNVWKYYRDYFPITLIKTTDLSPDNNYMFVLHPHGIMSLGAFGSLGTEACGFSKLFPALKIYLCTLKAQFWTPFRRDYLLCLGAVEVSTKGISYIFEQGTTGNIAIILAGGAKEVFYAKPGCYHLILKERKGFIKLALKHGAHLVPVFSFGETDLYNLVANPHGSRLRNFQEKMRSKFGFVPAFFYGRLLVYAPFLFDMPLRKPVWTVVGTPIPVQKVMEPSDEQVSLLHKIYIDKLTELFESNKMQYGIPEATKLTIV